jgi:hypothetical protein
MKAFRKPSDIILAERFIDNQPRHAFCIVQDTLPNPKSTHICVKLFVKLTGVVRLVRVCVENR